MSPLERYQADLKRQHFHADASQRAAVERLQQLYDALTAPPASLPVWQRWLFRRDTSVLTGVYLWGAPGRGKTYLMDRFYDSLRLERRRRVHFHRLMLEVHQVLSELPEMSNPLDEVARQLAAQCRLLCIDEFHVVDVADAMLLAGLLEGLARHSVILVITSNTAPEHLYPDGLQRARFVPAIERLQLECEIIEIAGTRDYRLEHLQHSGVYRVLRDDAEACEWLGASLRELLAGADVRYDTSLELLGRLLPARAVADGVAWFSFSGLCKACTSTRDYLELAREFHTVLLHGVPVMHAEADESAKRFIHLVDTLYDHNVKLMVAAADEPASLYLGQRLQAAFARTSSRLSEMSSQAYLARPHR